MQVAFSVTFLAKAIFDLFIYPSHKWDDNEVSNAFIAVGFSQRTYYKMALALAKILNRILIKGDVIGVFRLPATPAIRLHYGDGILYSLQLV